MFCAHGVTRCDVEERPLHVEFCPPSETEGNAYTFSCHIMYGVSHASAWMSIAFAILAMSPLLDGSC